MWYIYAIEYYSAISRGNSDKWMNQGQYCESSFVRSLEWSNTQRQKVGWWFPGAGGGGNEELVINGCRGSVLQEEKVLDMLVVMAVPQCEYT